jgi:Nickel responsive protein SCO4226-like
MTAFLVFRELPGVTRDQYSAAQRAVVDAVGRAGVSGQIRYLGGFFLPAEARAICVFDADSAAGVTAVNEQAGVPFTQVLEAVDLRLG